MVALGVGRVAPEDVLTDEQAAFVEGLRGELQERGGVGAYDAAFWREIRRRVGAMEIAEMGEAPGGLVELLRREGLGEEEGRGVLRRAAGLLGR